MRHVAYLLIAIAVALATGVGVNPARAASPCCSPACTCGCNDGAPSCDCSAAAYTWTVLADTDGDQIAVWRGEHQVGVWRISDQTYHPRLAPGRFGEASTPPATVPTLYRWRRHPNYPNINYGVDMPAAGGDEARPRGWSISGRPVSEDEARQALAGPALPDDAKLPWLLWVGDDATGSRIRAAAGDRARVQSVPAGHWITADRDGRPMYTAGLWVVRPTDRKAVAHVVTYDGPEQITEGLRRCDPNWKPEGVPDLSTPAIPLPSIPSVDIPPVAHVPLLMVGGASAAMAGMYLFGRRRPPAT